MRICFYFLILFLSNSVKSEEFKLREKTFYGGESMELQTVLKGGSSISYILNLTEPSAEELYIRLLSPLLGKAGEQLTAFYQTNMPKEFEAAISSRGDLHNPKIKPLFSKFNLAFETTTLFNELETALMRHGYRINGLRFEKFSISNNKIVVSEIALDCAKGT